MIVIPITYETYDDEPETITEKFSFNISKREWMELQIADEPLKDVIQKIIDSKSNEQVVNYLKQLVLMSYGIRTLDPNTGKMTKFKKSKEISDDFEDSAAFDKLIEDLMMSPTVDPMVVFIKGILPKEVVDTPEFGKVVEEAKEAIGTVATGPMASPAPQIT